MSYSVHRMRVLACALIIDGIVYLTSTPTYLLQDLLALYQKPAMYAYVVAGMPLVYEVTLRACLFALPCSPLCPCARLAACNRSITSQCYLFCRSDCCASWNVLRCEAHRA